MMLLNILAASQVLAAIATVANASTTCGQLKGCYIRDLTTGTETALSTTAPYSYDYVAGKSRHSIRCDVTNGAVDKMEFTFLPSNTVHQSWGAPYWIDGSNDKGWVEPADFLASCGTKTLQVAGSTWQKKCFAATFDLVAKCGTDCVFDLTAAQGTASAVVTKNSLTVNFKGAMPNTIYTIWVDFQSRATGKLSADYPVAANTLVDITKSGPAMGRGVAPAFAKTSPVYEGMRPDANSVKTDANGNGKLVVQLDYNLLKKGDSPVVAETLTMQAENIIGGGWLRQYEKAIAEGPSSQQLDANGVPKLVTATAEGLTIVGHFKPFTHGHHPGVGGVDHFMGAMGDFPAHCKMN